MTPTGRPSTTHDSQRRDILGIVQVSVPVTDLARSAAWYRDLLDLEYVREFGDEDRVTGCALADFDARFMVALRLRSTTQGEPDLRGEHPIIVEVTDQAAAGRMVDRATAMGIPHTSGEHADGHWMEFLDPDGIALRAVYAASGPRSFMGIRWEPGGDPLFYDSPRLRLPPPGV